MATIGTLRAIEVTGGEDQVVRPGKALSVSYTARNAGNIADDYSVTAVDVGGDDGDFDRIDVKGNRAPGRPVELQSFLPDDEPRTVIVKVSVPRSAEAGDRYLLQLNVVSNHDSTVRAQRVTTFTIQEYGVALTAPDDQETGAGGTVRFAYTLTNTGNGRDRDNFSLARPTDVVDGDSGNFAAISRIFPDADFDGEADNNTPINSTGYIDPGSTFGFVFTAQVPPSAEHDETYSAAVTATSFRDNTKSATAAATVTVIGPKVTAVLSGAVDADCNGTVGAFSSTSVDVDPGQCIAYRITATNVGGAVATSPTIGFELPEKTSMETCENACAHTLVDGDGNTVSDSVTEGSGSVSARLSDLPSGESRVLTFTLKVDETATFSSLGDTVLIAQADINWGGGGGVEAPQTSFMPTSRSLVVSG